MSQSRLSVHQHTCNRFRVPASFWQQCASANALTLLGCCYIYIARTLLGRHACRLLADHYLNCLLAELRTANAH